MNLLLVDFSNLVIRHAANPYGTAADSLGRSLQGPYGSINQVMRYLREPGAPTHMLIAKDSSRHDSVRRGIDPNYKSHRPETDDDLQRQFRIAYQLVEALGWPMQSLEGYEADDVIASAARHFPGRVQILTGDKDMLALTAHSNVRVLLLRPGGLLYCDRQECRRLYDVWPEQVRDYKALVGDKSDGINGVTGVGAKTAVKLLDKYQTLSNIYQAIDALGDDELLEGINKSMLDKLRNGREDARISWKLATLVNTIPIDYEKLQLQPLPAQEELEQLFKDLDATVIKDIF